MDPYGQPQPVYAQTDAYGQPVPQTYVPPQPVYGQPDPYGQPQPVYTQTTVHQPGYVAPPYTQTQTVTTTVQPVAPQQQVVVVQHTQPQNKDTNNAWMLLLVGFFCGAFFCWIPGACIGLRSSEPDAKVPGAINAVLSALSCIGLIGGIIAAVVTFNNLYNYVY
eukprot:TRINITY_DN439_c0_g1_i3.p1 TRINITY_DN439_c0_g1~~TRINITY_DN439_c0_g1_i3.p1  ORF type:complete len:164 (+),score=26.03 TRINITY_DN439_c0_g1_i3:252-743(+)